jgi:hypothetical protein
MYINNQNFNISASQKVLGSFGGDKNALESNQVLVVVILYDKEYRTLYAQGGSSVFLPMYNQTLSASYSSDPLSSSTSAIAGAAYGLKDVTSQAQTFNTAKTKTAVAND